MKSCFFIMHSFGGGAELLALNLIKNVKKLGSYIYLSCLWNNLKLKACISKDIQFSMPKNNSFWQVLSHILFIKRKVKEFDIVIGTLELQSIFFASLLAPKKTIAWIHKDISGYLIGKNKLYAFIYKLILAWSLKRCKTIICVSNGLKVSLSHLYPNLIPKIQVIYNAIDIEKIDKLKCEELPESLKKCFKKPVILGIGRLEKQKAFHLLIQFHAKLLSEGIDNNLCILGDGSLRKDLELLAKDLGVSDSVYMPGHINPYPVMLKSKVFALSSIFEGFSLVLREAVFLNMQIVAFDCPSGPREVLSDGLYGNLVSFMDIDAFYLALKAALFDNKISTNLNNNVYNKEFSNEFIFNQWAKLFT